MISNNEIKTIGCNNLEHNDKWPLLRAASISGMALHLCRTLIISMSYKLCRVRHLCANKRLTQQLLWVVPSI